MADCWQGTPQEMGGCRHSDCRRIGGRSKDTTSNSSGISATEIDASLVVRSEALASSIRSHPAAWFESELTHNEVTLVVFYRGYWWVTWPGYLQEFDYLAGEAQRNHHRGCKLYAICSQVQEEATRALKDWKLNYYAAVIGDNDNTIAQFFQDRYLPSLFVTDTTHKRGPMNQAAYPHGLVQPAVLAMVGNQPALAWSCRPSPTNLQGSIGRPDPSEVWHVVEACLKARDHGKPFECSDGHELIPVGAGSKNVCLHYISCCTIM